MEENRQFIVEKLEELDTKLRASDAVLELLGVGAAEFSNGDVILGLANFARGVIGDTLAALDEVGCALLDKERMSA